MTTLSIGQFTVLDTQVENFIELAATNNCQAVSVLVCSPSPQTPLPLVTSDNLSSVKAQLDTTGISILNVECFMITPRTDIESFRPALEIGAALQATGVTALLYDADESNVSDKLKQLCVLGQELGLRINIEFMPFSPRWTTLEAAADLIQQLNQPNLGLCIDILHLIRSGGVPDDITRIPKELIHYVQICDSPDGSAHMNYAKEAGSNRLAPGDGVLPIKEFLQALPAETPIEIEVPQLTETAAGERLSKIVKATYKQLETAGLK